MYEEREVALNIGIVYSRQKKHQLANELYERIIKESDDYAQIANAYNSKGYFLLTKSAVEKLPFLEKAVTYGADINEQLKTNFRLPTLAEIKNSENTLDVLTYLIDLADHYVKVFKVDNEKTHLLKAKDAVLLIDQLVSLIRYDVNSEASKLFWIEKGVNSYMLAVEICYLLNDVENAFYFMEKNKALLLQENIKTLQTKLGFNIPKELSEHEYKLNYEVFNLQTQFQQEIDNDSIQQAFADKKEEFQIFIDSLKRMYPEYVKIKEEVEIVSLAQTIKNYKKENAAFVEYILHDKQGYGIYYEGKGSIIFKISNIEKFQKQIETLRILMSERDMDTKERKEFQTIGFQLFQQLFPFKNALQRLQNKKITIIPDHTLQYIPFELLTTTKEGKLSEAYLVNTTEISYLQSF